MKSEEPSHLTELKKLATLAKWYERLSRINHWYFSGFTDSLQESLHELGVLPSGQSQHLNPDDSMFNLGTSFRHLN